MISESIIQQMVNVLVVFATDILIPMMVFVFFVGAALRLLNYYTLKRQYFFSVEFQRRVDEYIEAVDGESNVSFFHMAKKLLMITYYEIFEVTALLQRRRPDIILSFTDRVFLTKQGFAWLVKSTLKQLRYMKHGQHEPKLLDVSKNVFQSNPCFTKVFGLVSSSSINDFLNMLPGLFIIGGIFGTFLGIMKALPELGGMNLQDVEGTKLVMDQFLLKISFSMSTSIVGIFLSILMSLLNTAYSAEKLFMRTVDTYSNSLYELWNRSDNNALPSEALSFDEHKNPIDALAEEALNREYSKLKEYRKSQDVDQGSASDGGKQAS